MQKKDNNKNYVLKLRRKRQVYFQNELHEIEFCIYKNYFSFLGIPVFPTGTVYTAEIPELGAFYTHSATSKMPEKLVDICRDMERLL